MTIQRQPRARQLALTLAAALAAACSAATTPSEPKAPHAPPAATAAPAPANRIALGPVTLVVVRSRTASLFHVVDQISGWSTANHPQYAAWRPSTPEASALLARHVAVRARRGWGRGLEAALYVAEPDHHRALHAAIANGTLDPDDASEEAAILDGLGPLLEAEIAGGDARARELVGRVRSETETFARMSRQWLGLAGLPEPPPISIALIPGPGSKGGGGANGPVITVEVPESGDLGRTLMVVAHELVHQLLKPHLMGAINDAAVRCGDGLDVGTLNESLAYATAPGLLSFGTDGLDPSGKATLPSRSHLTVARAIRPVVAAALDDPREKDFEGVLAAACEAWKTRAGAAPVGAEPKELTTVTIGSVCWAGTPCVPAWLSNRTSRVPELMVVYEEWIPGRDYHQLEELEARVGHDFVLRAAGHTDVHVSLDGAKFSDGSGTFQAFGLKVAAADRAVFAAGVDYRLEPVNTSKAYRWVVKSDVVVRKP